MNSLYWETHFFGYLRYFVTGVGRVTATVIKEIANVMCFEDLNKAFVFSAAFIKPLELEARRSEGAAGRVHQGTNLFCRFTTGVDHVFCQRTDDAIATRIDFAYFIFVCTCGFNDATGGGINDGGHTA